MHDAGRGPQPAGRSIPRRERQPVVTAPILRSLLASLLLSGLGLAWILFEVGEPRDLLVALDLPPAFALFAVGAMVATFLFGGLRLQYVCHRLHLHLRLRHAVRTHILGMFSATVTPGGAGHTPGIALMLQHHGSTGGGAWAAGVAIFRADAIFHAWGLPLALATLYALGTVPRTPAWLAVGGSAIVITLALAYLLQFKVHWLRPIGSALLRGPLLRFRRPGMRFLEEMLRADRVFAGAPIGWQLGVQALTVGAWLSLFAVLYVLSRGLGIPLAFAGAAAIQAVVATTSILVPTPGASGFYELGISYLLLVKGGEASVPAVVLLWRLFTYYSVFLVGPMLGGYVLAKRVQRKGSARRV